MFNGQDAKPPSDVKKERIRAFLLACGHYAWQQEVEMHGGKTRTTARKRGPIDRRRGRGHKGAVG